jgi:arylformamidase
MKHLPPLLIVLGLFIMFNAQTIRAQTIKKDIPYAGVDDTKRSLDVYAPAGAKDLPVAFWIHGGGWHGGDKADVKLKPQAFMDKGFVFVSVNYRLMPAVDMGALVRDVAQSFRWMEDHIAEFGGDPKRVFVAGHSAGAQLAALLCTDERYLKEQGVSFDVLKGCMPVDGDTYDVPAIVETEELRWRLHGMTPPKVNHRNEFGNDADHLREFSAAYHVGKDKGIPPFLLLHITANPDTAAQAFRLGAVLKEAGIQATVLGARNVTHEQVNDRLGESDDPGTKAMYEFLSKIISK